MALNQFTPNHKLNVTIDGVVYEAHQMRDRGNNMDNYHSVLFKNNKGETLAKHRSKFSSVAHSGAISKLKKMLK